MTSDELRAELEAVGRRLAAADTERSAAMAELKCLVRLAKGDQVPIQQIAQLGGVSRVTVYRILEDS